MFEIIDDNGVIHSGNEEEMAVAFAAMKGDAEYFSNEDEFEEAREEYTIDGWEGDLKFIKVINITR